MQCVLLIADELAWWWTIYRDGLVLATTINRNHNFELPQAFWARLLLIKSFRPPFAHYYSTTLYIHTRIMLFVSHHSPTQQIFGTLLRATIRPRNEYSAQHIRESPFAQRQMFGTRSLVSHRSSTRCKFGIHFL